MMLANLLPNVQWETMWAATVETLYMTGMAVAATFVIGIVLGLLLFLTAKGNLWENRLANMIIAAFVNIFRSIPFIILIILLIPFTKWLVGTMLGANAALPALIIGAAPFYARMVEIALREIDKGSLKRRRPWAPRHGRSFGKSCCQNRFRRLSPGLLSPLCRLSATRRWLALLAPAGWGTWRIWKGSSAVITM